VPYIIAQVAGGVLGAMLAHAMFDLALVQASTNVRTGGAQWLAEGVATFGLLVTIYGCMQFRPQAVAAAVGLYISAGYWFTASTSFANPAVTTGRTLTDTFSGIQPVDAPGFIAAQLVGAALATWLAIWLSRRTHDD
jgi:glycerol uptake facilitator-like aquaporin